MLILVIDKNISKNKHVKSKGWLKHQLILGVNQLKFIAKTSKRNKTL